MAINKRELKSGGISYRVLVQDPNGEWYPTKQFSRKEDAKVYEASLLAQKSKGQTAIQAEYRGVTLSDYYHQTYKNEARTKVSQGQRNTENQLFKDHVEPYIGKLNLVDIRKQDISRVLCIELTSNKKLGWQQVTHVYSLLNQIFRYAIEVSDLRDSNPVLKRFKPEKQDYTPSYYKPDTARNFLEAVEGHWLGPAIWIMTATGLRVGEVIGLQYGDIDLANRAIYLRRQWSRKNKAITPVKNKKAETPLPIPDELAEYLASKLRLDAEPTDWVVQSRANPGKMAVYGTLYKTLIDLETKLGFSHVSPHGLRHTTSGIWNQEGAKRDDLRDLYNHKDGSITDRYNHEVPSRLAEIAQKVKLKKRPLLQVVQ